MRQSRRRGCVLAVTAAAVFLGLALPVFAQAPGGDGGGGRGGGRGGRRFDPAQMQAMMMQRMKESLEVSDADWPAIEPLLSDVMTKQREARGGMGRMFRRGRGGDDNAPQEVKDLEALLDNPNATAAEIKAKLDAYRAYRKTKEEELLAAQKKLQEVLTVKQEARLVLMGMLE